MGKRMAGSGITEFHQVFQHAKLLGYYREYVQNRDRISDIYVSGPDPFCTSAQ